MSSKFDRLYDKALAFWEYVSEGVWDDHRDILKVNIVKTLNLTVRTFFSTDLQSKACAMTYRTLLAIVPAIALLFAIGRGFGFQNLLQSQLFSYLPSQHRALEMAFSFVDSTLAQASEGIFVGVGIVFLLWTIISLLDSVEDTFNQVWGVTVDRSIFRKATDYLAICIILPILMICSGGLQVFMSTAIQKLLPHFMTPLLEVIFDCLSYMLAWLFFAGAYILIPNTRVRFKNAIVAGIVAGTAFQILQWLFISGQLYVAKYNAIYGSFSFLPLMLIWMQLSWLITLAGALICCAAQNISMFSYDKQTRTISFVYRRKIEIAVMAAIVQRMDAGKKPQTCSELSSTLTIPLRLMNETVKRLTEAGLTSHILPEGTTEVDPTMLPVVPALSPEKYTLEFVDRTLDNFGSSDFLNTFDAETAQLTPLLQAVAQAAQDKGKDVHLKFIQISKS
ncbi:MAG: YihY/virulence factor BrkB family protein [Muribaculaceae bacterium]|nr:YihY/virulence factor BrkB family protein [Muribaculaceae bacterium]